MNPVKLGKLLLLDLGIVALNVVIFSKALLGTFLGNPIYTPLAILLGLVSVIAFFYFNIKVLFLDKNQPRQVGTSMSDGATFEKYRDTISKFIDGEGFLFDDNLKILLSQLDTLEEKGLAIRKSLGERFSPSELTYGKFVTAVENVEEFMLKNAKGIVQRVQGFDERGYEKAVSDINTSPEVLDERRAILDEYSKYVKHSVDMGDKVLASLDKLQLEISKISTLDEKAGQSKEAVSDLDDIISDIKYYKDGLDKL
ncbi:MAG: hypothetical protein LBE38_11960 [Deltaproteobacteria bacterium]|jgi:hypothetical protein|nr:hypothetical protein [Deltaproteobacteria bacterium]